MPPRPRFASIFLTLIAAASLLGAACSESSPQDMRKGSDAALFWEPPDAGVVSYPDRAADKAGASDSAATVDGGITDGAAESEDS
jgi:hypothetical protein